MARIASARRASVLALARRLDHLGAPVGGVRPPAHEPLRFEVVDDHGRVGRVDPERRRRARPSTSAARASRRIARARPKLMPERLGDLAPALVVEHEVGHQQPDLARAVGGRAPRHPRASLRSERLRIELPPPCAGPTRRPGWWWPGRRARARRPPQAVSVHQAGWLAAARSRRRRRAEATIAPTTATPSVWPTCREVVAIAAATPAWARGIPDTAAFVIGALTKPKPRPKTTYAASSHASGVVGVDAGQHARTPVTRQTPAITSGRRGPRRPTMRPDSGDATTVISGHRHGGEPGLHRREAARLLEVERVEEEEPAERGERGDRDDDRRRERDRAEEAQVDQRLLAGGARRGAGPRSAAAAAESAARIAGEVQPRLRRFDDPEGQRRPAARSPAT